MYIFDTRLPKSTIYWKENKVFYIKHINCLTTIDEAGAAGELLTEAHRNKGTKQLSLQSRGQKCLSARGQQVLDGGIGRLSNEITKKLIKLTGNIIGVMQINRLSKSSETETISRAFCSKIKAFINA